jgi:hypothetical protein
VEVHPLQLARPDSQAVIIAACSASWSAALAAAARIVARIFGAAWASAARGLVGRLRGDLVGGLGGRDRLEPARTSADTSLRRPGEAAPRGLRRASAGPCQRGRLRPKRSLLLLTKAGD